MVNMINLKELRPGLPKVIRRIDTKLDRYIITRRSKPVAVMISLDDYDSLLETIEILSDKSLVRRIKKAKREIEQGKTITLEALRRKIEKANVV